MIRMDEAEPKGTSTLSGQTVTVSCVPLGTIACPHVTDGRSRSPLQRVTLSRATLLIYSTTGSGLQPLWVQILYVFSTSLGTSLGYRIAGLVGSHQGKGDSPFPGFAKSHVLTFRNSASMCAMGRFSPGDLAFKNQEGPLALLVLSLSSLGRDGKWVASW